jgi:paraquat-inducible protein B
VSKPNSKVSVASAPPPRSLVPEAPVSRPPRRSRFSPVWIIPLVSALLGLWLAWRYYSSKGPEITVRFENAEGIIAGKTPVLCRNVPVGTVTSLELAEDRNGVIVTAEMTREAAALLAEDSQIWVVRARYSSAGLSGLSTLFSGSYLGLQPGVSKNGRRNFIGLENPPITPPGVPGLRFKLIAKQASGLGPGAAIVYKGISVGRLETRVFRPETGEMQFSAFIGSDYARLVDEETLFYSAGGLDLKVGGGGVQLGGGTLESILSPSITFTEPTEGHLRSTPLPDGHTFVLYANFEEAHRPQFNPTLTYLLLFSGSVRGLSSDAPVEFRGIRVGTVVGASFKYFPDDPEHRIPVLIKIDPTLLLDQPASNPADAQELIAQNVGKGLRASLKSSSLLTGQLYVDLDFQKNPSPAMMANVGNYEVLPTAPAPGLDELQGKIGTLIDKLTALEVEKTVKNLNDALGGVKGAAANLDKLTASDGSLNKTLKNAEKLTDELSGNKDIGGTLHNLKETSVRLNQTISELSAQFKTVGQNLTEATDTLKRQPWRLVWPSTKKYDENSQVTTPRSRPTPSRRTSQSRR